MLQVAFAVTKQISSWLYPLETPCQLNCVKYSIRRYDKLCCKPQTNTCLVFQIKVQLVGVLKIITVH